MNFRFKFIFGLLALFPISFLLSPVSRAGNSQITADYTLTYNISEKGETEVMVLGQLHNSNQDVYISQYSQLLDQTEPKNVQAADAKGEIVPSVESVGKSSKITINFNDKVVGLGRNLDFKLSYSSGKIAQKSGLVWEINIPRAADYKNIQKYDVTINVPNSLGPPIYLSPDPESIEKSLTRKSYKYSAKTIAKTGAILSFGPFQLYRFNLKYTLKNNHLFTGTAKIALPPALFSEQELIYDSILPIPLNVEIDNDGNYLAVYKVPSGKTMTINVKGRAKILNPIRDISRSGTFSEIPPSLNVYIRPQKYWETGSPQIQKIVKEVAGEINPESQVSVVAQKLFDYATKSLTYDESRIKPEMARLGALGALKNNSSAVCMEFADLLVTLLRAAGIPAQVLEGFAYTKGDSNRPAIGDVLHSWVRLYLPRLGWIAVDPTWSHTTGGLDYFSHLDTNHFVFAIKGSDSETPYPAGAYKISPDQTGDIDVKVLDNTDDLESPAVVTTKLGRDFSLLGKNSKFTLAVVNQGKTTVFGARIYFNNGQFKNAKFPFDLGDLPPFGKKILTLDSTEVLNNVTTKGKISFASFEGDVKTEIINLGADSKGSLPTPSILISVLVGSLGGLGLYGFVLYWLWRKHSLRP